MEKIKKELARAIWNAAIDYYNLLPVEPVKALAIRNDILCGIEVARDERAKVHDFETARQLDKYSNDINARFCFMYAQSALEGKERVPTFKEKIRDDFDVHYWRTLERYVNLVTQKSSLRSMYAVLKKRRRQCTSGAEYWRLVKLMSKVKRGYQKMEIKCRKAHAQMDMFDKVYKGLNGGKDHVEEIGF